MIRHAPALLLALLPVAAAAQQPGTTERYFPLTGVRGFIGLADELQRRADERGGARVNHFSMVWRELSSRDEPTPLPSAVSFWEE